MSNKKDRRKIKKYIRYLKKSIRKACGLTKKELYGKRWGHRNE